MPSGSDSSNFSGIGSGCPSSPMRYAYAVWMRNEYGLPVLEETPESVRTGRSKMEILIMIATIVDARDCAARVSHAARQMGITDASDVTAARHSASDSCTA